ncbi:MAG: nucleoside diphosphate kinase regulator [Gemmobacter sp.]|nr:nucleoside diphosphate kinase regulator [Gemmobacter sp.]
MTMQTAKASVVPSLNSAVRPHFLLIHKESKSMNTPAPSTEAHAKTSPRLPKILLDKTLVGRLETLATAMMRRSPELGERLIDEIARAKLVSPEKLRGDIVTIGSEVTYRDLSTARVQTVVVVFPEDADIDQHRISVVTPVGVALLGLSVGAKISWVTRDDETRQLEVVTVKPPAER